jgi:hypothetical protein
LSRNRPWSLHREKDEQQHYENSSSRNKIFKYVEGCRRLDRLNIEYARTRLDIYSANGRIDDCRKEWLTKLKRTGTGVSEVWNFTKNEKDSET